MTNVDKENIAPAVYLSDSKILSPVSPLPFTVKVDSHEGAGFAQSVKVDSREGAGFAQSVKVDQRTDLGEILETLPTNELHTLKLFIAPETPVFAQTKPRHAATFEVWIFDSKEQMMKTLLWGHRFGEKAHTFLREIISCLTPYGENIRSDERVVFLRERSMMASIDDICLELGCFLEEAIADYDLSVERCPCV